MSEQAAGQSQSPERASTEKQLSQTVSAEPGGLDTARMQAYSSQADQRNVFEKTASAFARGVVGPFVGLAQIATGNTHDIYIENAKNDATMSGAVADFVGSTAGMLVDFYALGKVFRRLFRAGVDWRRRRALFRWWVGRCRWRQLGVLMVS